jgi:hypothetical protein
VVVADAIGQADKTDKKEEATDRTDKSVGKEATVICTPWQIGEPGRTSLKHPAYRSLPRYVR